MKTHKVIIIGIDGATFDIILPMVARGELPHFKTLMDQGAWAELTSVYPSQTVPAWPCCYTGKNPGKVGVFDFRADSHLSYDEGPFLLSTDITATPLWRLLSNRKRKVLVAGMPLTYPPAKVNGVMVAPVRVIETDQIKTHPPELARELNQKLNLRDVIAQRRRYMTLHRSLQVSDLQEFFDQCIASSHLVIEKLGEIARYLLATQPYDFGMFMLPVDAIQHHFWHHMDKQHPAHAPELARHYGETVFDGYRWVDQELGLILAGIDPEQTTLILVSDHGFGPLHKEFYANRWLLQQGLLKLKPTSPYTLDVRRISVAALLQRLKLGRLVPQLSSRIRNQKIPMIYRRPKSASQLIDWEQTRAYATAYALNINLKGREPLGIVSPGEEYLSLVDQIQRRLPQLIDPQTGKTVVDRVVTKETLYHGPHVEAAPDLLVFFKDPTYSLRKDCLYPDLFRTLTAKDRLTGHHTSFPQGICILKGPAIVPGTRAQAPSLLDIAPTTLFLMGEAVPEDMDGRVLTEVIRPDHLKEMPVRRSKGSPGDDGSDQETPGALSDEDRAAIEERLIQLGYMG